MQEEMKRAAQNKVVRPSAAQMQASQKENLDAVICTTSPAYINLDRNYRVNGQPVSKG